MRGSSSSPIKSSKRGLAITCFRIAALVILSHGVWHGSGHELPGETEWPAALDLFSSSDSSSPALQLAEPRGLYYFRRVRSDPVIANFIGGGGSVFEGHKTIRACSNRLRYILMEICDGNFHNPSIRKRSGGGGEENNPFIFRRVQRAVVNECCSKSCSMESLRKYCKDGSGLPHPVEASSQTTIPEPSEEAIESAENDGMAAASAESTDPEPAILSIIRFINFMVNRQNSNPRSTSSTSGEKSLPVPEQRIQDRHHATGPLAVSSFGRSSSSSPSQLAPDHVEAAAARHRGGHPSMLVSPVEQDHGRLFQPGHASGRNAVTSTLPPFLIRVGPITSDYV